jgi:hypothetical protein
MIVQTGIFMLTAAGISILLWAGICMLTILYKSRQAERHDTKYTPKGTIIGFIITGLIGQVIYWTLAWLILQGTASGTVAMMRSNAQKVYETAEEYSQNHDGEITSVSGTNLNRFDYAYDSLESEIIRAFPYEQSPFWFKVVTDSKGNVMAAYFARHEITSKDMRPVDSEMQKKMLLNPYMGEDSITGSWTAADANRNSRIWGDQGDAD